MLLKEIATDPALYPDFIRPLLAGARLYDSSCSPEARVIYIEKDGGYFLKEAPKGALEREAAMTRFFHKKGLSAQVLTYFSDERDWLLTVKIPGEDCTAAEYLAAPERLCDLLAERLALLHTLDTAGCPVQNHTAGYLASAERGWRAGRFDAALFPPEWGCATAAEARAAIEKNGCYLRADTLLHGDYCLPNIILKHWRFSGLIDLDSGGVGDPHVDLFWGIWTLYFNLKTNRYRERFLDAYGRDRVDEELLHLVAAVERFG